MSISWQKRHKKKKYTFNHPHLMFASEKMVHSNYIVVSKRTVKHTLVQYYKCQYTYISSNNAVLLPEHHPIAFVSERGDGGALKLAKIGVR